jgi:type IV pilus assembly protein PilA
MKFEFQAKYLQHILSKKQNNEGFTLIELLVVIIIVGILAAIALPSFLTQVNRARASEGVNNVGALIRAQQVERLEATEYAGALAGVDAKITGNYYDYSFANNNATAVNVLTTNKQADVKLVSGRIVSDTNSDFQSIVCLSNAVQAETAKTAAVPTSGAGLALSCDGTYTATK